MIRTRGQSPGVLSVFFQGAPGACETMKIHAGLAFGPALPRLRGAIPADAPVDRVELSPTARASRSPVPRGMVRVGSGSVRYGPGAGDLRGRLEERGVRLIGVRHGQTEMNARPVPVLCGQNETPLSEIGRRQAARAAEQILAQLGGEVPVIYASPLSRARQTAEALADRLPGAEVAEDPRLLEIHYGDYEHRTVPEMHAERPVFGQRFDSFDGEGTNFLERFPGGESRADVVARVASFLEEVADRHPGRTVIAFCHQETLVAARAALGLARTQDGKLRADAPAVLNATPMPLTCPGVGSFPGT